MHRLNRIAVIAALLSAATAAHSADSKNKSHDDGRICTMEPVVGSHFPRRVCTTAAQRDETRSASQDGFQNLRDFSNRSVRPSAGASR